MKACRIFAIGVAIAAVTAANAQTSDEPLKVRTAIFGDSRDKAVDLKKIKNSYLRCLSSRNPGVVESALTHVTHMRIACPQEDLKEIEALLFGLATRGYTRAIRYKAFMAIQVFANPAGFKDAIDSNYTSSDGFFQVLASRVEQ